MTLALAPTESDVLAAVRAFLLAALPAGFDPNAVVRGQVNRTAAPSAKDYVVIWPLRRDRLATNTDGYADAKFTGSIAGTTMTIASVAWGELGVGSMMFGVGVAAGTRVIAFGTGAGGMGTYQVAPAQTLTSRILSAGTKAALQPTEVTLQIDVHGPNSGDNAQRISTLFRDEFATELITGINPAITPLYADGPRQVPFLNENDQIEERWTIDTCLQVDDVVSDVPQQFADQAVVRVISVDSTYPP